MNTILILLTQAADGRVFGLDTQTLIQIGMQLLNAVILAVALTFILYKPVKAFLNERSKGIQDDIDNANETMSRAKDLIAEYEAKIEDINSERIEIIEAARQEANEERKAILTEAEQEVHTMRQKAQALIAEDKLRLHEELRVHVVDLSSLIAQKYVSVHMDDETQENYFNKMIDELEGSKWPS